mmetsp:Transcript_42448/g.83290  ORF Transcript_42448/g.83290 Transcript_42448/m.83290 type:complete len:312 (+) Transcript_42448:68-1003(+)|eukprot:CAMPEP_0175151144 /NCGR_PEP_ID=MMETSP0087-20121206/18316_1 /TAXON_ID=136419 /ORGANISM="Unknown Unknown, Strain D1" /LENGTH=311 /DNA_ID=CAMNT_0016437275 /DNA_START=68 /DNA_END=1003 /DNA_ORIENTATION=-
MMATISSTMLLLFHCAVSYFILDGFSYPLGSSPTREPLRGVEPGNLWQPPVSGANRVKCGYIVQNSERYGVRTNVNAAESFEILGSVLDSHGTGSLTFQVKFGDKPDFSSSPGFDYSTTVKFDAPSAFQVPLLQSSNGSYSGPATVQAEYKAGLVSYYQCVDLVFDGGTTVPVGGWVNGFGPREQEMAERALKTSEITSEVAGGSGSSSGLSDFHISLLILVPMLLLCGGWLCYRVLKPAAEDSVVEAHPELGRSLKTTPPEYTGTLKRSTDTTDLDTTGTNNTTDERTDDSFNSGSSRLGRSAHFHFQYL